MRKNDLCPLCVKEQKGIDLEETNNEFICCKCNEKIVITSIDNSGKVNGYRMNENKSN